MPFGRRDLTGRWRQFGALYRGSDPAAGQRRARHLKGVMCSSPALMLANIANALLVLLALGDTVPLTPRAAWAAGLIGFCGWHLQVWWRWRQRKPAAVSARTLGRATWSAAMLALLWSLAPLAWFAQVTPDQRMLLGMLSVGMMAGGAFALAPLPQAALAYLAVFTACSATSLALMPGGAFLVGLQTVYGLTLGWIALSSAEGLSRRLLAQDEAERQTQVVGLLLRDFEDHAADLLWEVDPAGHLSHTAPRLAQAMGHPPEALDGFTLLDLLTPPPRRLPRGPQRASDTRSPGDGTGEHGPSGRKRLAPLQQALDAGQAFSRVTVAVQTVEGPRWWSITAKPLLGAQGQGQGWRGVISDVTQARETHRQLAYLAHFDPLTGLANRIRFREHLLQALQGAGQQPARRAALFCLDLDHFKAINDTLGHAAGDTVLVTVAERMRKVLRADDLPARLGGDEFALVIADAEDPVALDALARRLVHALCQPVTIDGQPVPIGVSLGIAVAPEHGTGIDDLMAHADLALYAAKETGRGRHEVFLPRLGDRRRRRLAIEQGLRDALARGELTLHWQPRVPIHGGKPIGAEALLRWQHPTLGELSPVEFVRVAEEAGLMAAIGAWCLQQACREAAALPGDLTISVNVSATQLRRNDFLDTVHGALAGAGLPPQRLELEVTETLLVDGEAVALEHLHRLRAAGVRVALDDFGTGYSSLDYLRRFPFDTLKIDRSFTRELTLREDSRAIVRTILELARTLGMHTLAEGVEEAAQLQLLREAGCEAFQGYLVARPMPAAALAQRLRLWPDDAMGPPGAGARSPAAPRAPSRQPQPHPIGGRATAGAIAGTGAGANVGPSQRPAAASHASATSAPSSAPA